MIMRFPVLRGFNTAAFLLMVLVNWMANAIPIGGRTAGEVSSMFPVLVTPAFYASTIWIAIYVLLGCFVWLQWLPRWSGLPVFRTIGPWFAVTCVLNILWILLWHQLYIPSAAFMMIALLLALTILYPLTRRAGSTPRDSGFVVRTFVQLPFSIYLAWITVASIVNVSVGLSAAGWNGWGLPETFWAVLMMVLAGGIAYVMYRRHQDTTYVLVIVWALVAIGVKQRPFEPDIAWFAWILSAVLMLLALRVIPAVQRKKKGLSQK
jgi:benzodiazapine receptor